MWAVCYFMWGLHIGGYNCLIVQIREEEKAIKVQSFLFGGQSRKGKKQWKCRESDFKFPSITFASGQGVS